MSFYSFPHSIIILPLNDIGMTEKEGTECGMIENHSTPISVIEWVSNDEIWLEWGWNEKEKNLGHLPCFKNFIIPPSFQSLTIILRWENGHSSIISFTLRSFSVRMTIEWHKRHFKMTQNDRDGLGMRKIKIISVKNVPHSTFIQVIPTPFWVEWHMWSYMATEDRMRLKWCWMMRKWEFE